MSPIVHQIEATVGARSVQKQARRALFTEAAEAFQIVWADDLAVPLIAMDNEQIEQEVRETFQSIYRIFHAHGVTLNMSDNSVSKCACIP